MQIYFTKFMLQQQ